MKKGSITVYMALTLLVMISFFTAIIESARVNAMKVKMNCTTDLAIDSCLAEYCIPMLEQYGLFFIDTAYGGSSGNYYDTASHMEEYVKKNLDAFYEKSDNAAVGGLSEAAFRDWYGLTVENVTLTEGYYATDQKGEVLRQQAIDFMFNYYGMDEAMDLIAETTGNYETVLSNGWDKEDYTVENQMADNQGEIQNSQGQEGEIEHTYITEDGQEVTEVETVTIDSEDPTTSLTNDREMILLNYILKDDASCLSNKAIKLDQYISHRQCANVGETPSYQADTATELTNKFLFDEYILLKCDFFDKEKSEKLLEYEVEYILGGKSSDKDNLQYVTNRILLMREVANMAYLAVDDGKKELINTAALLFGLGISFLVELYKVLFTAGWAYLESLQDMRDLFNGKKVPLVKTDATWKTDLDNLIYGSNNVKEVDSGMDYKDYLRVLLALEDETTKTARLMDVMEMNIRGVDGYSKFRMDCQIEGFVAQVSYRCKMGYTAVITKKRVYDTGPEFRN